MESRVGPDMIEVGVLVQFRTFGFQNWLFEVISKWFCMVLRRGINKHIFCNEKHDVSLKRTKNRDIRNKSTFKGPLKLSLSSQGGCIGTLVWIQTLSGWGPVRVGAHMGPYGAHMGPPGQVRTQGSTGLHKALGNPRNPGFLDYFFDFCGIFKILIKY